MSASQHDLALGYAWGCQDTEGGDRDLDWLTARRFAVMFASLDGVYQRNLTSKPSLSGAWQEWREHDRLTYETPAGVQREIVTEMDGYTAHSLDRECKPARQ